jgi:hypothetical protein
VVLETVAPETTASVATVSETSASVTAEAEDLSPTELGSGDRATNLSRE